MIMISPELNLIYKAIQTERILNDLEFIDKLQSYKWSDSTRKMIDKAKEERQKMIDKLLFNS